MNETISFSEWRIICMLREMKSMETIIVEKDRQGKIDKFFYKRIESGWLDQGDDKKVGSRNL